MIVDLCISELSMYMHIQLQIEQEIDLMLGQKDVKAAGREWDTKWGPAIIELSKTMTGKQAVVYKENQMTCQGINLLVLHGRVHNLSPVLCDLALSCVIFYSIQGTWIGKVFCHFCNYVDNSNDCVSKQAVCLHSL